MPVLAAKHKKNWGSKSPHPIFTSLAWSAKTGIKAKAIGSCFCLKSSASYPPCRSRIARVSFNSFLASLLTAYESLTLIANASGHGSGSIAAATLPRTVIARGTERMFGRSKRPLLRQTFKEPQACDTSKFMDNNLHERTASHRRVQGIIADRARASRQVHCRERRLMDPRRVQARYGGHCCG